MEGTIETKDQENSLSVIDAESIKELWSKTYNTEGKPDWSHILPYYDENVFFWDSVQKIHGLDEFTEMTQRLADRSKDLKMNVLRAVKDDMIIFIEWEMTISYKKNPSSIIYGSSRITLSDEGKIIEQRDYYDLWGDIFDNIPRFGKAYRRFMRKKFG
ncbi:MAG: nuclear transport factor 2 family protein [Bacteroidales bacterium]|nr:nuclear transport factor 2 family protein [Bacteroidales bacterium]